jgi:rhodanese-related sulfurtransferase
VKRIRLVLLLALAAMLAAPSVTADSILMARQFAFLFQGVDGPQAGKALHLMKPAELVTRLKRGERIIALDVRTPAEAAVYGMTLPETLAIPINRLFMPENLRRVPRDRLVLVVCKSGTRATAAGTALRAVGFSNVYVLKGGLAALGDYLSPVTANAPVAAAGK